MVRRNGGRRKRYPLRNGRRYWRRYGSARDDSDEEYVLDEDEEDGDFGSDASLGIDDVSDEEEEGRDLVRASRRKTTGFHMCWGRKKGRNIGKFQEKEEVEKRKRGHQMRRRSRISYIEEDWKVEEDSEDDEDPSSTDEEEDEEDEEENVTVRKKPVKRKRKVAKNSTVSKNKKRGHQMRRRSRISYTEEDWKVEEDSEDDEDLSSTDEEEDQEDEEENVTVRERLLKRKRKVAKNKKDRKPVKCQRRLNSDDEEEEEEDDDDFTITDENLSDTDEILMRKKFRRSIYPLRRHSRKISVVDCDVADFELQNPVVATCRKLRQNAVVPETKVKEGENGKEIEKYKGKEKKIGGLNENICGICISKERKGIFRGFLNSCSHYFCFSCIVEWSKLETRCPLCKKRFTEITKSLNSNVGSCMGSCVKKIPKRDQVYRPTEEEVQEFLDPYANVVCIVCQHDEDDNLMLLCDLCDSSAHTYCVGHGRQVPDGSWFCDACTLLTPFESNMDNQRDSTIEGPLQNSEVRLPQNSNVRSEAVARGDRDISSSFTSPQHDQTQSSSHSEMLQIGSSTLLHRREVYQHIQNLRTTREPPGEELP